MTLEKLFNDYRSDKGSIFEAHKYSDAYEKLINPNIENLLEIGIGADWSTKEWVDPLGTCGSIRAWLDWLPNATIYGFDIKDASLDLKNNSRFKLLMGSQDKIEDLEKLKNFIPMCDVIIDDGSHISQHQIKTFEVLWSKLKWGGYYFIEDIHCRWGEPPHALEFFKDHPNFFSFMGRSDQGLVFKK